jgi:hypothetical protein
MRISRCLAAALLAVLALLSLAPDPRAQADDGSSLDVAILDILKARGIIDDAQYAELMALARSRVDRERSEIDLIQGRLERLRAPDLQTEGGTPGKLKWKSSDGKWSFNLKGRVIGRVEDFNSDDGALDDTNFHADFRLNMEGNAGAENVTYKVELDAPTNKNRVDPATEPGFNLRDAYINWAFESGVNAEIGQFKFPFGREMLTSSAQTDLMERSIASVQFSPEYEPGAMAWGTAQNGVWEFYAAMANGEGRSKNNTPGDDLNGLRDGVRVVWNPLGAFKLDGPAFQTMDEETTKIGVGAAYMVNHDSAGLATATAGSDTATLGLEFQVFSGPVSFLAENYSRQGDVSGGPNVDDDGYTLQAGWFFLPNVWEVVARLSAIDFDAADDQQEAVLGLNYYVDRHNGKWMVDFSKLDNQGTTPDAKRIRLQYQLIF